MKPPIPNSPLNPESAASRQPPPWLEKHYEEKRQRTVRLVKAAVDQLVKEEQTVTIEAICRRSAEVDHEGRGVKKSAILENPVAHAYYRQHSASYQTAKNRQRRSKPTTSQKQTRRLRIEPRRDVNRTYYRYLRLNKADLVERLLTVEQAYAESQQQLARLQFELLES